MTLGSHQKSIELSQNYITPKWILDRLGEFDLDPCAADPRPWGCAETNWTSHGLDRPWFGTVYLNPPFSRYQVGEWISRLAEHGNGVALLHARTEAEWFEPCWRSASMILFMADRIKFCKADGTEHSANSGAPPVLVGFGASGAARLERCTIPGALVKVWQWRDHDVITARRAA